jgi:hypothetical protein
VNRQVRYAFILLITIAGIVLFFTNFLPAATGTASDSPSFPRSLDSYGDSQLTSIVSILTNRIQQEPFNLLATIIFLMAIVHTFFTGRFMAISHKWEREHQSKIINGEAARGSVSHGAEAFHFLGEVEAVFGIWAGVLVLVIILFYDWETAVNYISHGVNFTEAMFVVVIMTLASTRPILRLTDQIIRKIAAKMGGTLTATWLTTLTIGPILGSLITEPAAMTICALVLAKNLYELEPSTKFKYATLGLLFVNISVGGTETHFAAPPVLMVAGPWNWDTLHMLTHFGWKAVLGIVVSNGIYFWVFRKEIQALEQKFSLVVLKEDIQKNYMRRRDMDAMFDNIAREVGKKTGARQAIEAEIKTIEREVRQRLEQHFIPKLARNGVEHDLVHKAFKERFEEIKLREMRRAFPALLPQNQQGPFVDPDWDRRDDPVPTWVTLIHLFFMAWTIVNAHHPELFIPGILFFIGFSMVTHPFQNRLDLKAPILVGFFLGGLVIHGGLQGWWIAPILSNLSEIPLMIGAALLTAFNDNAAITFLSTLVPGLTDSLKYAVVAGAVAGGGLTIIANAPNPAGVSILKKYFNDEVAPMGIVLGAAVPTVVMLLMFLLPS